MPAPRGRGSSFFLMGVRIDIPENRYILSMDITIYNDSIKGVIMDSGAGWRHMNRFRHKKSFGVPFFWAYFFYYAAYAVFSGNAVLFLTERGFSAAVCGAVTSAMLVLSLVMQPAGGYITDTFCSTRRYLAGGILVFVVLCCWCTAQRENRAYTAAGMILGAGIVYPFGQLMDAWVKMSSSADPELRYSRIRAGGSFGFAVMSVLAGQWFRRFGWDQYFLMQAAVFLLMLPLLLLLPELKPANRAGSGGRETNEITEGTEAGKAGRLSAGESVRLLLGNRSYLYWFLVCTVYWFSHRPIGSFLSLLVRERGGDAGTYGNVCGAGAVFEFLCLLLMSRGGILKKPGMLMPAALLTDLLRPLCFLAFPGLMPVYAGQVLQSLSFALYYTASVEGFLHTSDPRIRSFSISTGLSLSSALGTAGANLSGGRLCDLYGPGILPEICFAAAAANLLLYHTIKKIKNGLVIR